MSLPDDAEILLNSPSHDSDRILTIARELVRKINRAFQEENLSGEDMAACNVAITAYGLVYEHADAVNFAKCKSTNDQMHRTNTQELQKNLAKILALEFIQKQKFDNIGGDSSAG